MVAASLGCVRGVDSAHYCTAVLCGILDGVPVLLARG